MKWIKGFIYFAGAILFAAALIRFIVAAGDAPALSLPEPMLGIPLRYAVLTVGVLELIVALICLFGRQTHIQIVWLAWLATDYLVFQIALFLNHGHPQATCIGSLTDPLQLTAGLPGKILQFIPISLSLGSYAALVLVWLERKKRRASEFIKTPCPACGVHIRFARKNHGQEIACPNCRTAIILRKPDERLKISCYFCQGHIEFPAHSLGQKMQCPHCQLDIMLKLPDSARASAAPG